MKLAFLVLFLAGCVHLTPQQQAERAVANYGPACETYGFTRGTPEFGNCILQLRAHGIAALGAAAAAQGANAQIQQNMRQATQPK